MLFDTSTELGQHVQKRLQEEEVVWLTTVRPDGQPIPIPVWFLWDGESEMLIYSAPDTPKIRNITRQPKVSINFDSNGNGGDIVQFDGEARVDPDTPIATGVDEYLEKFLSSIGDIGETPDSFAATYSTAIRVRLTNLRAH